RVHRGGRGTLHLGVGARAVGGGPPPPRSHVLLVRALPARPGCGARRRRPRPHHRGPHPGLRARHGRPERPGRRLPLGFPDMTRARSLLAAPGDALLDERRQLKPEELAALAAFADESVPALAALAHEVRLAWCGPDVEVEGIISAKTGGCPEDCHFCSQSAKFESPVQALPLLEPTEVLAAARETAQLGASEFCLVLAIRGPTSAPCRSCSTWCRSCATTPASTSPSARASSRASRPSASRMRACTATTTTWRQRARSSRRSSAPTRGRSASTRAGWCASTAWSCAAAPCSAWASRTSSAWSCWASCATSTRP